MVQIQIVCVANMKKWIKKPKKNYNKSVWWEIKTNTTATKKTCKASLLPTLKREEKKIKKN